MCFILLYYTLYLFSFINTKLLTYLLFKIKFYLEQSALYFPLFVHSFANNCLLFNNFIKNKKVFLCILYSCVYSFANNYLLLKTKFNLEQSGVFMYLCGFFSPLFIRLQIIIY